MFLKFIGCLYNNSFTAVSFKKSQTHHLEAPLLLLKLRRTYRSSQEFGQVQILTLGSRFCMPDSLPDDADTARP